MKSSKNLFIGISLVVVLASAAISLALMQQKAFAVTTVDPCLALRSAYNAAKAKLISDITSNNFASFGTDLNALIKAINALALAGCSP